MKKEKYIQGYRLVIIDQTYAYSRELQQKCRKIYESYLFNIFDAIINFSYSRRIANSICIHNFPEIDLRPEYLKHLRMFKTQQRRNGFMLHVDHFQAEPIDLYQEFGNYLFNDHVRSLDKAPQRAAVFDFLFDERKYAYLFADWIYQRNFSIPNLLPGYEEEDILFIHLPPHLDSLIIPYTGKQKEALEQEIRRLESLWEKSNWTPSDLTGGYSSYSDAFSGLLEKFYIRSLNQKNHREGHRLSSLKGLSI